MALDTFNAVAFTLTFLMPGFVWSAVLSTLVPRRPQEGEVRFLEFLTLSFVNNAAWAGVVVYLWRSGSLYRSPEWTSLWAFLVLFVSPALCRVLPETASQKDAVS